MLEEGHTAPDVTLTTLHATSIDACAPGRPLVVVFFRDVAGTQAHDLALDFQRLLYEFELLGVRVVGVGVDGPDAAWALADGCALQYELVDDRSRQVCRAFAVLDAPSGRPLPCTFMIDVDGSVRRAFASLPSYGHAQDVLDEARALWS